MSRSLSELLDCLVSIRQPRDARIASVDELHAHVADLLGTPTDTGRLAAWQQAQESFDANVAGIVLQLISRTLAQIEIRGSFCSRDCCLLAKTLTLLQGSLFLHPRSTRLFERAGSMEVLIMVLKLRPVAVSTSEAVAPTAEEHEKLIYQALCALLAAIIDRPRNARVFKQSGGLADVADLLRGRDVGEEVRRACLELLFFYLAPEEQTGPPAPTQSTLVKSLAHHPHRHSSCAPARAVKPPEVHSSPIGCDTGLANPFAAPASPGKKRPWSARPSIVAEVEQTASSTPRRTAKGSDTDSTRRRTPAATSFRPETPHGASRHPILGTPLVKSPSTPEHMSEALASDATTSGSNSTPNTPERPRTSHRSSMVGSKGSAGLALPPRQPLGISSSAPQLLASLPARSRTSFNAAYKPNEIFSALLAKSSTSEAPTKARAGLASSTPSPASPRRPRESFTISRDITPLSSSKSRPLLASPSKRASIGGVVRGPGSNPLRERHDSLAPLDHVAETVLDAEGSVIIRA